MPSHPIDVHVGRRVRERRTLLGMSQGAFGKAAGITFQQIQKYENGSNRISASRLYEFGKILDAPVAFFFEGAPTSGAPRRKPARGQQPTDESGLLIKRETLQLVRAFYNIREKRSRQLIAAFIKGLAAGK